MHKNYIAQKTPYNNNDSLIYNRRITSLRLRPDWTLAFVCFSLFLYIFVLGYMYIYTAFRKKHPLTFFFHISMNYLWI